MNTERDHHCTRSRYTHKVRYIMDYYYSVNRIENRYNRPISKVYLHYKNV